MPLGTIGNDGHVATPAGYDEDYGYSWEPLKPYMDGDTLVIPAMDVIADSYWGSCLSAKMVARALLKHKDATSIKLLVNCPGGNVTEGTAIYSLLVDDPRPVEAHVIGLAASMATILILAADVRVLHTGCMLMVHEPSLAWTGGNRHQLRSDANRLDINTEAMLDIYETRTGADREELAALMAAETWLSAEDGRRLGFGTAIEGVAEPVMTALRSDEGWNARRGAALAMYKLPDEVREGTELGWSGLSLADLRAANAISEAHGFKTLTMALDGLRRAQPAAQQTIPQREATPPPRAAIKPQPAASTSRNPTMDEETLKALGLSPGATVEQIAGAIKAQATKNLELQAKATAETQARLEAEARERIAEEQRKSEAREAQEARELASFETTYAAFIADVTDGPKATFEKMCFTTMKGPDGKEKRMPNPEGFASAKVLADTLPGARKSTLSGPSPQVAAARETADKPIGSAPVGPLTYRFGGSSTVINLSKIARVTPAKVAERQAEMKSRHEAKQQFGS